MELKILKKSLIESPIIERGNYRYFIHPITDGIPRLYPDLLREIARSVIICADTDVDAIVTMEAMGIHISTVLSEMTDIPVNIVRKKKYNLPGEVVIHQKTGYSKGEMYLNSINRGDRILIFDAVISTGGTMCAVIDALNQRGAVIKDAVAVIERGDGVARVFEQTGIRVKTIIKVDVEEGVKIKSDIFKK